MMQLIIKYVKRLLFAFISIFAGYLICALLLSLLTIQPEKSDCPADRQIFVTSNGIHLDIIIPKSSLNQRLQRNLPADESIHFLAFGWGDKRFYLETPTWEDLKFSTAVQALFFPSETAMHVTRYQYDSPSWKKLDICEEQLRRLNAFIAKSFIRNHRGEFIKIGFPGYTIYDTFYEAERNYSFVYTCNNWVNEALKEADVKTAVWSPFAWGVLYHLEE